MKTTKNNGEIDSLKLKSIRVYLVTIFANNYEKWFLRTIFENCFLIFLKLQFVYKSKMFLICF